MRQRITLIADSSDHAAVLRMVQGVYVESVEDIPDPIIDKFLVTIVSEPLGTEPISQEWMREWIRQQIQGTGTTYTVSVEAKS